MSQDLANINLTIEELAALNAALDTINTTLGDRMVSLTPDQRRSLVKMGGKTQVFCEQAAIGLKDNLASLPDDLDVPGLTQDVADFTGLQAFFVRYNQTAESIDDTLKALSSDIMTSCIVGVTFLKALNKLKPSLDTLLKSLTELRRRKPVPKTPPAP